MIFDLLEAQEVYFKEKFADYRGISPVDNSLVSAHFSLGFLPPKRQDKTEGGQGHDFPFVVFRPINSEDDQVDDVAKGFEQVNIICGAYVDPKEMTIREGVLEILRMTTKIRNGLKALPNLMLDEMFGLQFPLKTHYGIDGDGGQPHPYYYSETKTRWSIPPVPHNIPL